MMREILERFRYRFELWQRKDLGAQPRDTSHYHDPRNTTIITESTSRFVIRAAAVFLCGLAILIVIGSLLATAWPSVRHSADIVVVVLIAVWTTGVALTILDMCRARRKHRDKARKEI
jgi:membrane protein YdbS with pleckstrin-like domain